MTTEIQSTDSASQRDQNHRQPGDREERRIEAMQRLYGHVLRDEPRVGETALRRIDAALRGEQVDE
jgi:hypothetical protein